MERYIERFGDDDSLDFCIGQICKDEHKYNYIKKDGSIVNSCFCEEQINLDDIKNNMFINSCNQGRFGNYIFSACEIIIELLKFHEFLDDDYNEADIISKIKSDTLNSKLYSPFCCQNLDDPQSGVKDKYKFKTTGISSFKYFKCHHFEFSVSVSKYVFDEKYIDIELEFINNNDPELYGNISQLYIFVRNEKLYFYIKYVNSNYRHKLELTVNKDLKFVDMIIPFFNTKPNIVRRKMTNNILINAYYDFVDGKINNIDNDLIYNELKKCSSDNKFIAVSTCKNAYFDDYITGYEKSILDVLFEDSNNIVHKLYGELLSEHTGKTLISAHFRAGDFERNIGEIYGIKHDTMNWKILTPVFYIENIKIIKNKKSIENSNIVLFMSFHPSDLKFFMAYENIIKTEFPGITTIIEILYIERFDDKIKNIFTDEPMHILFMSLFDTMIMSNSTYSKCATLINTNKDKLILGEYDTCYGYSTQDTINNNCGMSLSIYFVWKHSYNIFYEVYTNIISGNFELDKIFLIRNGVLHDDINVNNNFITDDFIKSIIYYVKNTMKINIGGNIYQITLDNYGGYYLYCVIQKVEIGGGYKKYMKYIKKHEFMNH
jgi:hypothetical protein